MRCDSRISKWETRRQSPLCFQVDIVLSLVFRIVPGVNKSLKYAKSQAIMLSITPFMEREGCCGPACLKMVLDYYGISKTEEELIQLTGCVKEQGLPGQALLDAAYQCGLEGKIQDYSTLDDLQQMVNEEKIPVIVNWFPDFDGHYSVATGIDDENVYLVDPDMGYLRALRRDIFQTLWFDFPGKYIEKPEDIILRRMIILHLPYEDSLVNERDTSRLRGGKGRRSSRSR